MRHKKEKKTIDRTAAGRQALLRALCISLIKQEALNTTPVKAKVTRSMIEKMITRAKNPDTLSAVKILEKQLGNKKAAYQLVKKIAPRFVKRTSGYTSITKLTPRKGDCAAQVRLELLTDK
ncbi:MAG: 50S ribosomal protein L17 [Candidatus Kerfeldbacteria bacterium RIFOXYA2_FULL_38_24]|uniref:50S ribosomal protein L17 n=1 Tax=Candidatus Kerfeldbacteria bacterium RIFOXYB2_FULL_38_14 TaxID=1798547 RepID=A0A1G2BA73_9BACT|nr:MAG: 50S ribosomal protein L17 [Candidatus Kerfeldbacteria bacterium RIFOXYA2_FULL_38_24]OGY86051.1 MAG: 50S ribosomal protein L17 [Candidatus Kerfeldbacteria bacterium RIFOXYB2_FULL_38_14]OGY90166.1 MAG: 50S ribosomal protein L17 [Candidatus Kerfeldbacteria bacterium RIFOXYC2_FULL_38_9]